MENQTFNQLLEQAIETFQTIFLGKLKGYSRYMSDPAEYRLLIERLKKGMQLDGSGLTTYLELKQSLPQILDGISFTALNQIENKSALDEFSADFQKLADFLDAPEAINAENEFYDQLYKKMTKYMKNGLSKVDFNLLLKRSNFADICFDALNHADKLETSQFSQGKKTSSEVVLNEPILGFWSAETLVAYLNAQESDGIGLYGIIDKLSFENFFVFGVKNGENITLLSDKFDPLNLIELQETYRYPERYVVTRNKSSYLPYNLLDIKLEKIDGEIYAYAGNTEHKKVLAKKGEPVRLGDIFALPKESCLWIFFMVRMISQQYFKKNTHRERLAYTGEKFLKEERPTITSSEELKKLKNGWMIDYYRKQGRLDEELLFPVTHSGEYLSMIYDGERFVLQDRKDNPQNKAQGVKWEEESGIRKRIASLWEDAYVFVPSVFGTAQALENQISYIQQANLAAELSCLLRYDYRTQTRDFRKKYIKRLKGRMGWLLEKIAKCQEEPLPLTVFLIDPAEQYPGSFSSHWFTVKGADDPYRYQRSDYVLGNYEAKKFADRNWPETVATCAVTGKKATIECQIMVSSLDDLLYLTGWKISDLPVPMQHYSFNKEFSREDPQMKKMDPIDRVVNPFGPPFLYSSNQFHVTIPLSKTGYADLRKQYGLKPDKFW